MEQATGLDDWLPKPQGLGHFGDPAAETAALLEGVGLELFLARVVWQVEGGDALSYLHRMTTQALEQLAPGAARPTCLLTPKGRILADLLVWRTDAGVFAGTSLAAAAEALPVLEKYVIADDVTFRDISQTVRVGRLIGPDAGALLSRLALDPDSEVQRGEVAGVSITVVQRNLGATPGWRLIVPESGAGTVFDAFLEAGAARCGPESYERARIEAGVARYGHEFGPERFFNEVALEEHIHWSKGCYPGQEPVVMARHRGNPPRLLMAFTAGQGAVPEGGAALAFEDADVGQLTSVAPGRGSAAWFGLGYVRHAQAVDGACFSVAGSETAIARGLAP